MRVNGRKLIVKLGLDYNNVTVADVLGVLSEIGKDRFEQILNECAIKPVSYTVTDVNSVSQFIKVEPARVDYNLSARTKQLNKELKHTQSYFRRRQLQQELLECKLLDKRLIRR